MRHHEDVRGSAQFFSSHKMDNEGNNWLECGVNEKTINHSGVGRALTRELSDSAAFFVVHVSARHEHLPDRIRGRTRGHYGETI